MTTRIRDLDYHINYWPARGVPASLTLWMCHGWMDVGMSFQFVVDQLPQDWNIYAPDWRGYGRSDFTREDTYWFYDYIGDLDALTDSFSPDKPINLVGHSMGGNISTLYAGVRPNRVRRLINLEGMGLKTTDPADAPGRLADWLDQLRKPQQFAEYRSMVDVAARLRSNNARLSEDKALFIAEHWAEKQSDGRVALRSDPRHKMVNPYQYRVDETLAIWESITAPMLLVVSEHRSDWHEFTQSEEYRDRLARISNLRQVEIKDAGHMMHHDQPKVVADMIVGFVQ